MNVTLNIWGLFPLSISMQIFSLLFLFKVSSWSNKRTTEVHLASQKKCTQPFFPGISVASLLHHACKTSTKIYRRRRILCVHSFWLSCTYAFLCVNSALATFCLGLVFFAPLCAKGETLPRAVFWRGKNGHEKEREVAERKPKQENSSRTRHLLVFFIFRLPCACVLRGENPPSLICGPLAAILSFRSGFPPWACP